MLTSEKQVGLRGPWQIKTRDGIYYQPESLASLYQWLFENRLCADDFIFSARDNDWIPIFNMPELKCCFWQLLTGGDVVYGPISIGELKQLYVNKEISHSNKVAIFGKENWTKVDEIEVLHNWLQSQGAVDYVQFVSELEVVFEYRKGMSKEIKARRRLRELEKCNKELENKLAIKSKELEELLTRKDEFNERFQSIQEELKNLQGNLQEKIVFIEELNKQIAQAEVTNTLKDDQINQLQSSIASLQEELKVVRCENISLKESLPETARDLDARIDELDNKNRELVENLNELHNEISTNEKEIAFYKEEISNLQRSVSLKEAEIASYRNSVASMQEELDRKIKTIDEITNNAGHLGTVIQTKDEEISNLLRTVSNIEAEITGYRDTIARLQAESAEKDRFLVEAGELKTDIEELNNEANIYKQEIERLKQVAEENLSRLREEMGSKEETMNRLRCELGYLEEENKQKIDDLESLVLEKKAAIDKMEDEREALNKEIIRLKGQYTEDLRREGDKLQEEITSRESTITELRRDLDNLEGEYRQRIDSLEMLITEKEDIINGVNTDRENLRLRSDRLEEDIRIREDTINKLKHSIEDLRAEYEIKAKDWEGASITQKMQFQNELVEKTRIWEESLKAEREKWGNIRQELEGGVAQRDAQIEEEKLEIERLQETLISLDKQWKERVKVIQEEREKVYKDLENQREDLRNELSQKINGLVTEKDYLQARLNDTEPRYEELIQYKDRLEKELLDRDRFIELIKKDAKEKEESYCKQLKDVQERLYQSSTEIEKLQQMVGELTRQLQNELDIQEGLRRDKALLNEDLVTTRQLVKELERQKDESQELRLHLEREVDGVKRELENSHEENRSLQKQFYIEKQKLTKEYNETISKMERLQKRSQLEREIQDRTRMKEELERLYNLIKENFDGLQRGAQEIQASLQGIGDDMDNKRLSLKYITETEKREEKKGQFPRTESAEEAGTAL